MKVKVHISFYLENYSNNLKKKKKKKDMSLVQERYEKQPRELLNEAQLNYTI